MTTTDNEQLLHANALRLDSYGLLIVGASGSGKSLVTRVLIERAALMHRQAVLISDDYVLLRRHADRLVAHAPEAIRGAMEIRGAGLFATPYQEKNALDLVVKLEENGERFPNGQYFSCLDVTLPVLKLPQIGKTDVLAICHAVEAYLFATGWPS